MRNSPLGAGPTIFPSHTGEISNTQGRGGRRSAPYAFTEHGVAMLSSVLGSPRAIAVNIEIMRMFACSTCPIIAQRRVTVSTTFVSTLPTFGRAAERRRRESIYREPKVRGKGRGSGTLWPGELGQSRRLTDALSVKPGVRFRAV